LAVTGDELLLDGGMENQLEINENNINNNSKNIAHIILGYRGTKCRWGRLKSAVFDKRTISLNVL